MRLIEISLCFISLLLVAPSASAQSASDRLAEIPSLQASVLEALRGAVAYGEMGDRSSACVSSKFAQTQLSRVDDDVRFITNAVADSDEMRTAWAGKAASLASWIAFHRQVAMTDWQNTC